MSSKVVLAQTHVAAGGMAFCVYGGEGDEGCAGEDGLAGGEGDGEGGAVGEPCAGGGAAVAINFNDFCINGILPE